MDKKRLVGKNDVVLIGALIAVFAVIVLLLMAGKTEGNKVVVSVSGNVIKTFPINKDTTYEIPGAYGGKNYLIIENGEAYLTDATCPDKICIHMGKISMVGQSIICLPNEVVITVEGDGQNRQADTVTQ